MKDFTAAELEAKAAAILGKKPAKMDSKLLALKQEWELDTLQYKLKLAGYKVTRDQIREAVGVVGRGRKKVVVQLIKIGVIT